MVNFITRTIDQVDKYDGVLVIDTHTQGAWEYGDHKFFKQTFPKVYKTYFRLCLQDPPAPGTAYLIEEQGYTIALLFTKEKLKQQEETVVANFESCLKDLFRLVGEYNHLYSPILGRNEKCFNSLFPVLKRLTAEYKGTWNICRNNRRENVIAS